ncbi:MAG: GNAT family N-acetyltransferase, partial [Phototrophicales bacterium]
FRNLRLYALQESPTSFSSAYEDEVARPLVHTIERLKHQQQPNNCIYGAFAQEELIGMAGFFQHEALKLRHKSIIWGVYVLPDWRRQGVARQMMEVILNQIRTLPAVKQVHVTVVNNNDNVAAKQMYLELGFVEWGVEPRAILIDGQYYDEACLVYMLD